MATILICPGLSDSGPAHWQSLWEQSMTQAVRVQQADWDNPTRTAWMAGLASAVSTVSDEVILVAHSLGCALVAHWMAAGMPGLTGTQKIQGALLVAPPDVGRAGFPAPCFSPMPTVPFPFPVKVIASDNDPWCDIAVSRAWAEAWQAEFHNIGAKGHINSESGLGDWKQGKDWLSELLSQAG
ncbi:RBBP9/YdeN family alpha/beta hydrolase [Undibacterium griseum]|uniref:Alpha/beta hydrolase n=1 Tax=Undibacterium griseum TaxID=2762295 RepID=A0ABR6YI67_9BURK|nr:alpha/beta hydrolase [Undibacterium griseum]MBC3883601.1 alpha/beta hydrolase [Undibacterium griseum]